MKPIRLILCCFILAACAASGCSKPDTPSPSDLKQARKQFVWTCKNEFGYDIFTRRYENTLWFYLPVDSLFQIKAAPKLPAGFGETARPLLLRYSDSVFENETFKIEYDIIPATKSQDYGYTNNYTEEFNKIQNNVLTTIFRTFAELGSEEEGPEAQKNVPDFLIVIFADVVHGIETRSIFYFSDFKKYMAGAYLGRAQSLPYDEYIKRYITEIKGDANIIGDKKGRYLKYENLTWADFLAKQITTRIQFKYQRSDFPPGDDAVKEILTIVKEAVETYGFNDFERIELNDLRQGKVESFEKSTLKQF